MQAICAAYDLRLDSRHRRGGLVGQLLGLTRDATDLSQVQMPEREGRLSDVEMTAAVERFMTTLRAR